MPSLKDIAFAIFTAGLIYGLPQIAVLGLDFSSFGQTTLLLMRLGLLVLMVYFLTGGDGRGS